MILLGWNQMILLLVGDFLNNVAYKCALWCHAPTAKEKPYSFHNGGDGFI